MAPFTSDNVLAAVWRAFSVPAFKISIIWSGSCAKPSRRVRMGLVEPG